MRAKMHRFVIFARLNRRSARMRRGGRTRQGRRIHNRTACTRQPLVACEETEAALLLKETHESAPV